MRESKMGNRNPMYGKKYTEEEKKALSERQSKKILCVETGAIYNSIKEARDILRIYSSNISKAASGILKTYKGFHWSYVENDT